MGGGARAEPARYLDVMRDLLVDPESVVIIQPIQSHEPHTLDPRQHPTAHMHVPQLTAFLSRLLHAEALDVATPHRRR